MNNIIVTYSIYLTISALLTVWVARTLFKNGKIFLVDIFHGNKELADNVNNLLLVGFYLLNIGYAVFAMTIDHDIVNTRDIFETLSIKIGLIILVLGIMHFLNLYVFFKLRRRANMENKFKAPVVYHD